MLSLTKFELIKITVFDARLQVRIKQSPDDFQALEFSIKANVYGKICVHLFSDTMTVACRTTCAQQIGPVNQGT
jgi:hypothetical protein